MESMNCTDVVRSADPGHSKRLTRTENNSSALVSLNLSWRALTTVKLMVTPVARTTGHALCHSFFLL